MLCETRKHIKSSRTRRISQHKYECWVMCSVWCKRRALDSCRFSIRARSRNSIRNTKTTHTAILAFCKRLFVLAEIENIARHVNHCVAGKLWFLLYILWTIVYNDDDILEKVRVVHFLVTPRSWILPGCVPLQSKYWWNGNLVCRAMGIYFIKYIMIFDLLSNYDLLVCGVFTWSLHTSVFLQ